MKKKALILGSNTEYNDDVVISEQNRSSHMHVLGATGTGKSRFLLSLIQQDIENKRGLCLIDPHGELYEHTLDWVSHRPAMLNFRKVRLINITALDWCFGFNPLKASSPEQRDATVSVAVSAIAQVLGGGDLNQTPLLKETLRHVCLALSYANMTLAEAPYLLNFDYHKERAKIIAHIDYEPHRMVWDKYQSLSKSEYHEYFSSASRRFETFISNQFVRRIFGQNEQVIDFKEAMDNGDIILVNLGREGGFMPHESAELIGRLIVNNLMAKAFERPSKDKPSPFTLYVDEAHRYLSSDIATILAETRKYGLHMVLSHQLLSQLREAGEEVLAGVMGNARTKAVFALEDPEDAKIMAERVFVDEFDYERAKTSLNKPVVVGHEVVRMRNYSSNSSQSQGTSDSNSISSSRTETTGSAEGSGYAGSVASSESYGEGSSEVISEAATFVEAPSSPLGSLGNNMFDDAIRISQATTTANSQTSGHGYSEGTSQSKSFSNSESMAVGSGQSNSTGTSNNSSQGESEGYSETLRPILQWMPSAVYSLEEQKHAFMRTIMRLPRQHALIAFPQEKSMLVKARDVPDLTSFSKRKTRLFHELGEKSPYLRLAEEVDLEIEERSNLFDFNDNEETGWG